MRRQLNKYFKRSEFACACGCGFRTVDMELLEILTDVREWFELPLIINSGCRCERHNRKIGGSSRSKHIFGCAADIYMSLADMSEVYDYIDRKYPDEYGLGLHDTFLHVDIRSTKWRKIY